MSDENNSEKHIRLSDKVLDALQCALEQQDKDISEQLVRSLELAMTRNTGGADFVERREFSDEVEKALSDFAELKKKTASA